MHNNILLNDFKGIGNEKLDLDAERNIIRLILNILSMKSEEAASHCIRVSNLCYRIGKVLSLSDKDMKDLYISSILHDIGKIFIKDEILNKPAILTRTEYETIKKHSTKGAQIINKIEKLSGVSQIILYHHERYDGKGYPYGLKGQEAPLLSRIISVADAFDAMTSPRSYKLTLSVNEAVDELNKGRFTQFDGEIVDVFIDAIINENSL